MVDFENSEFLLSILYFTFVYLQYPIIQVFRKSLEWIPRKNQTRLWIKFGLYMVFCKMYAIAIFILTCHQARVQKDTEQIRRTT